MALAEGALLKPLSKVFSVTNSASAWTAVITELWNCPMTATAWSCVASFRNPAEPFSGVPESSSMTSSIFRPPA